MDRVVNAAATARYAGRKAVALKARPPDNKWNGRNVDRDQNAPTGQMPQRVLIKRTGRNVRMANVQTGLKPVALTVTGPMRAIRIDQTDRITIALNVLTTTAQTGLMPVALTGTTVPTDPIAGVQIAPIDRTGTDRIDRTGQIITVRTGIVRTAPMQDVLTGRTIPHDRIIVRTDRIGTAVVTIVTSTIAGTVISGAVTGIDVTTATGGDMITASVAGPV